jgi:hypothetical protein
VAVTLPHDWRVECQLCGAEYGARREQDVDGWIAEHMQHVHGESLLPFGPGPAWGYGWDRP